MPTQAIAGYNGRVYLSSDGGVTFNEILELRNVTIKVQTEVLDATSHSSNGAKEITVGPQSWSASADGLYAPAGAGQLALINAVLNKTLCQFRFDPSNTGAGKERFTGSGYITNWENAQPTSDFSAENLEITGSGLLVRAVQ